MIDLLIEVTQFDPRHMKVVLSGPGVAKVTRALSKEWGTGPGRTFRIFYDSVGEFIDHVVETVEELGRDRRPGAGRVFVRVVADYAQAW
ncbi:MAG TPA: hypothetical protein VIY27_02745 [Myxococcota bacterium]